MYGKIAIALVIAAILVAAGSVAYATTTQTLNSLDQTCAPLNSYKLTDNKVVIHDTVKDKSVTYIQGPHQKSVLCTYEYNYSYDYGYFGYLVLVLFIGALICGILHFKYDNEEDDVI